MKRLEMIGKRFGNLTVVEEAGKKGKRLLYKCICDCGNYKTISCNNLVWGHTKSCGCLKHKSRPENSKKHGLSYTRLYKIRNGMLNRCSNKNLDSYKYYGEKGIKVCEEWKNNFMAFYEWSLKNGYNDKLSIDRIDNNKDYCPENCRWVDMNVQQNNKPNNLLFMKDGIVKTFSEIAKDLGLTYQGLYSRFCKNGRILYGFKQIKRS